MAFTATELLVRADALKTDRGNWESMWQEIADNLFGRRNFISSITPGLKRNSRIYDSTAFRSNELMASMLYSLLTDIESRWFTLSLEDTDRMDHPDAIAWLEGATNQMLIAYSRQGANFAPQAHEMLFDTVGFGTGGMFIQDEPGSGPVFSSRPLGELYISENIAGIVDTVFRRFELTARQADELFETTPRAAAKAIEDGKWEDKAEYIHAVLPNPDLVLGNLDFTGMPFISYHIDMTEKDFIDQPKGFWQMPFLTPRWEKDAGELYGRGPGVVALSDAIMLNQMSRTSLKGAQKAVDPPGYIPNDGILSNLNFQPGGMTIVDANLMARMGGLPIVHQPQTANIGLGVEMENRRQASIEADFYADIIQMFKDPRMTATQVVELVRQSSRILSPVIGRQRNEYLEPNLDRVFDIELRGGRLPPIPEVLSGQNVKVDYVSPVSRAAKAEESRSISGVIGQAIEVSQVDPTVLDNFDLDLAFREIAGNADIPSRIMRDPRIVQALREQRAQEQAQREQLALMNEAGQTAARLLPASAKAAQINQETAASA
ncbi:MAG: portal protein [Nannocystaceae bacterium]